MTPFTTLTSIPAPLRLINVDTDMIIPKQFLRTIKRSGLASGLFYELSFDESGNKKPDFILNRAPYSQSRILLAGDNFGCGSSREHAPWALLDFGFRCIIAPSFGDIFYNNSFKNGILPIRLPQNEIDDLIEAANQERAISINLPEQKIICGNTVFSFDIDPFRKHCLVNGLDEISLTLEKSSLISNYETKRKQSTPWL
jgi:3-isopropylmalate/(R)-2-methylmalate dehydratase small subunit